MGISEDQLSSLNSFVWVRLPVLLPRTHFYSKILGDRDTTALLAQLIFFMTSGSLMGLSPLFLSLKLLIQLPQFMSPVFPAFLL